MSKKEVTGKVKLSLPAGKANPGPPVGPSVSPYGINLKKFVDDFNNATKGDMGYSIPVIITIYKDRSFSLEFKKPLVSSLILKALGLDKGSSDANEKSGKLTKKQVEEIVEVKIQDLNTISKEAAAKIVEGSARSMGIEVEE